MAAFLAARPASTLATIAGGSARHSYTTSGDVTLDAGRGPGTGRGCAPLALLRQGDALQVSQTGPAP